MGKRVTHEDKIGIIPKGNRINQWWDSDANEHKEAINDNEAILDAHVNNTENPHNLTKEQLGLSNVDNTSDLEKPISNATATAIGEVDAKAEQNKINLENLSVSNIAGLQGALDEKENLTNKQTDLTSTNPDHYPNVVAVKEALSDRLKYVDNISDFRNLNKVEERIVLLGYFNLSDKDPIIYYWDDSNEDQDNGFNVIKLNNIEAGRYLLNVSGAFDASHAGANKGNTSQENEIAINKVLNITNAVIIPKGVMFDVENLVIDENSVLLNENGGFISSSTEIKGAKSFANHMLIRGYKDGTPLRLHLEPNGYIDNGVQAKLDWMFDPYEEDPNQYRIAQVTTSNDYSQGSNGKAFIGLKNAGDNHYGIFAMANFGFNDDSASGGVMKMVNFDVDDGVWRTTFKGAWRLNKVVNVGDFIISNYKLYEVKTNGLISGERPIHNSGTQSINGVEYLFVRDYLQQGASGRIKPTLLVGARNVMPLFGFSTGGLQIATDEIIHNGNQRRWVDSSNTQKYFQGVIPTGAMRFGTSSQVYTIFDGNKKTREVYGMSRVLARKILTDTGASISLKNAELVTINNTEETLITSFSGEPNQRVRISSTNENTIIQNNSGINLTGGNTRRLKKNEHIDLQVGGDGVEVTEVSAYVGRNIRKSNDPTYNVQDIDYSKIVLLDNDNVTVNFNASSLIDEGDSVKIIWTGGTKITFNGCIVASNKKSESSISNSVFSVVKISENQYLLSGELDNI